MHGPTCLYGSTSGDGQNQINLETSSIYDVYPLLYYGASATITDSDLILPYAHDDGEEGAFIAATLEVAAGDDESGIIIVSGSSPYGDYRPMYCASYFDMVLNGYLFVNQAINYSISILLTSDITTTTTTTTTIESTTTSSESTTTETESPTTTTTNPNSEPIPLSDLSLLVSVGSIAVVAVFLILIYRGRKAAQWSQPWDKYG